MRFSFARAHGMALLLAVVGARAGGAYIEVGEDELRVRFGFAFNLRAPLSAVADVESPPGPIPLALGVGVHGWRGVWAVNGARTPHLIVRFDPAQPARTLGIPIRVHTLHLAPADPVTLAETLATRTRL